MVERWLARSAALAALVPLGAALHGVWRAQFHPRGRATGLERELARAPRSLRVLRAAAYLVVLGGYLWSCRAMWRPLPLRLAPPVRLLALILGALLYFPGLALVLWGRLALGEMYNVSTGLGVQLFANHRLVTRGPYALVRHPIYLGLLLAALAGTLIYRTWTLVFIAFHLLVVLADRARREEEALRLEFGAEWEAYRQRVPGWIPRR